MTSTTTTTTKECLYYKTVYALRENSSTVKCNRPATKIMKCAVPPNGKAAKPPYNVGNEVKDVDLCWKHYRDVDYFLGGEGSRRPRKRQ